MRHVASAKLFEGRFPLASFGWEKSMEDESVGWETTRN
jgi:hypothetical protein